MTETQKHALAVITEFASSVIRAEGSSLRAAVHTYDVGIERIYGAVGVVFEHEKPYDFEALYFYDVDPYDEDASCHTLRIDGVGYVVDAVRVGETHALLLFIQECHNWKQNRSYVIKDLSMEHMDYKKTTSILDLDPYEANGMIVQARFDNELEALAKSSNEIPKEDR